MTTKTNTGAAFVAVLLTAAIIAAAVGWIAMLTVGGLWHEFDILKPLGYWASTGLTLGVSTILGILQAKIPSK